MIFEPSNTPGNIYPKLLIDYSLQIILCHQITHVGRNFANFDLKTNKGFNEAPIRFLVTYFMVLDTLVRR